MEKSKSNRALNTSGESLYEDAVSQTINNVTNVFTNSILMHSSNFNISKLNSFAFVSFLQKPQLSQQSDATFVTTADDAEIETLSPRGTYVIPKNASTSKTPNATFNVEYQANSTKRVVNDQTVVLKPKPMQKTKDSGASIMTEDDSDSDAGSRNTTKSKKDPKELFK